MEICWICDSPANTGEHLTKASDLKLFFPHVTQENPVYLHNHKRSNQLVRSRKSKLLKSGALICNRCNSSLTQPYDFAWERLSKFIFENKQSIVCSRRIRLKKLFHGCSVRSSIFIQLYFIKIFGCLIYETTHKELLGGFSHCLIHGVAHDDVELFFYYTDDWFSVGMSDLEVTYDNVHDCVGRAHWIYSVGNFSVKVRYLHPKSRHLERRSGWHPTGNSGFLRVVEI